MKRLLALAIVAFLGQSNAAFAQYHHHHYGPGFGGGFGYQSGYQFSFNGPGYRFSSYSYSRGFYAAPIVPFSYSYGWVPAAGPGFGPGFGNPFFLPPPPFAGPILPVANNVPANPDAAPLRNRNDGAPALAVKGEFLVISPKGTSTTRVGEGGTISPVVDRVAAPPDRLPPAFRFDPFADRRALGERDLPKLDPAAEAADQVKRARESFAVEEYGRAVEHLDRALRAQPDDVRATFLKGQGQFAAGQYTEAVATIQAGIQATPNWAANGFQVKGLYAKPEQFEAQLADLRKATAANPTQPSLQFLLAYQLWFSGERPEATKLFQDLARRLKDPSAVEPFLRK